MIKNLVTNLSSKTYLIIPLKTQATIPALTAPTKTTTKRLAEPQTAPSPPPTAPAREEINKTRLSGFIDNLNKKTIKS